VLVWDDHLDGAGGRRRTRARAVGRFDRRPRRLGEGHRGDAGRRAYPIIGDADFEVSKLYGMLPADTSGDAKARTPTDNQTVRNVFAIGPDKKVKLVLVYPMTTGRNFDRCCASSTRCS
jgi:hypothetical protein